MDTTDTNIHTHVVIGDMHNRRRVVLNLFEKLELIDHRGNRNPGFHVTQLGDVLSLGYGEQEAEFYEWVKSFIDVQHVGNHDYPAFGPSSDTMQFVGWENRDTVAEQAVRRDFNRAMMEQDTDTWTLASNLGPWLITHAGLTIAGQKELGIGKTAAEYAALLNELWYEHLEGGAPAEPLILDTRQHGNGVLWVRLPYLRAGYREMHVPQIVGHTGYDGNQKYAPPCLQSKAKNLWALDTPGSCAALVSKDGGQTLELVESDYEVRYDDNRLQDNTYDRETGIKV